nr:replication associated protein [Flumine microvirus 28]
MPCSNPLQGYLVDIVKKSGESGKKFLPVRTLRERFKAGLSMPVDAVGAPCRSCMPCRLEKSRVTALRCTHEARVFENNCFITLTFNDDSLKEYMPCFDGLYSLERKIVQDFMKRLRMKFQRGWTYVLRDGKERVCSSSEVRAYGCGEYGEECMTCRRSRRFCVCSFFVSDLGRPHFHFCLFNCHFPDRVFEGGRDGFRYYSSKCLSSLWEYGFSSVCDFSFETAAYVARYCTKKISGEKAVKHYRGRLPEFPIYPTRGGGLGKPWFEKYGETDVIPTDSCIARYVKCGVPEYYDRLRGRFDPDGLAEAKKIRSERAKLHVDDNTYARLQDKERCMNSKIKCLVRRLEQ